MKFFIILFVSTLIVSYSIHKIIGVFLKNLLKKRGKLEVFKRYEKEDKAKRTLKDTLKIKIIFFIPVLNVLIAFVEIFNYKNCSVKMLSEVMKFEEKEKRLNEKYKDVEEHNYDSLNEEQELLNGKINEENKQRENFKEDKKYKDVNEFLREKGYDELSKDDSSKESKVDIEEINKYVDKIVNKDNDNNDK